MGLKLGSLFAGIGNFERGLGLEPSWQIEADPFRREVLEARFDAELLGDVREASGLPSVDVLCGGFPCQDLSLAGRGEGIRGARSGLWGEFARIIREQEPEMIFIENVPALLRRGFDLVVHDLVEAGYRVEWDCIPAAAIGAPHLRDRVWVIAHRHDEPICFGPEANLVWLDALEGDEWRRWPRAGFVLDDPDAFTGLRPCATLASAKRRAILPTPAAQAYGSSQNGINGRGGRDERPSAGTPSLETMARRGSLPLLPTPVKRDHKGQDLPNRHLGPTGKGGSLGDMAARGIWPTPTEGDAKASGSRNLPGSRAHSGVSLTDAVRDDRQEAAKRSRLFSTPKSEPSGPDYARRHRDESGGDDLAAQVARGEAGQLNPDWVEWLMGMPCGWTDPESSELEEFAGWHEEPCPRVASGTPRRNARLSAIGDSLVAQIPAWIAAQAGAKVSG